MSTINESIKSALKSQKEVIAKEYREYIISQIESAKRQLGPELVRIGNDSTWGKVWFNTLKHYVVRTGGTEAKIADRALLVGSEQYAEAAVQEWEDKLVEKLGEITEADVRYVRGDGSLNIAGMKGEHRIQLVQHRIINQSTKGVLFNQYPALIYVDGKKVSAAKYKSL